MSVYFIIYKYYLISMTILSLSSYFQKLIIQIKCQLEVFFRNVLYQFSSVTQSCPILCNPMDCSMPGFPVHHQLPELAQTHVLQVSDAIQPSHLLSSPSSPAFSLSQHQGLFQWVSSSHQVAKVLELQLQHQPFQWIFRIDFLYDWLRWSPCSPNFIMWMQKLSFTFRSHF